MKEVDKLNYDYLLNVDKIAYLLAFEIFKIKKEV